MQYITEYVIESKKKYILSKMNLFENDLTKIRTVIRFLLVNITNRNDEPKLHDVEETLS